MICAIHQPHFIPWLGYFDKIFRADVFVFLDCVQFKKNEYQNRNRVLTPQGPAWLTVPVSFRFGDRIDQVKVAADGRWRKKLLRTVAMSYARAPGYAAAFPGFEAIILEESWRSLAELNTATVLWLLDLFGIRTPTHRCTDLGPLSDAPTGRLIDICRAVGADVYLSGAGGRDYLEQELFEAAGIELVFQDFEHPVYPQGGRGRFVSHLSAMDRVMWAPGPFPART
ncbi:MAG: WbqC family protein [Kiritimatiellaeota bacterium]|nr:WbqC family protein [Kiritimatiellota bacterium]